MQNFLLLHQSSLSSFGAQRQGCNLQSVYFRSLSDISDLIWLLRGLEYANTTGSKYPFYPDCGHQIRWFRRQSDLNHLTSTEEASAGSSQQLTLSASAKWHGLLTASKAFNG